MSRCRQCNVEILEETDRCPLCNSVLEKTIEVEDMYPDVQLRVRKWALAARIYLFLAILVEVLLVFINIVSESGIWWSAVTGLAFLYGYLVVRFAILGKSGYKSKTIILTLIAVLVAVAIDFVVGYRGWAVNYALPAGIMLIDAGILALMVINRRNWQSYLMWQILMVFAGLTILLFYAVGIITVFYPSLLAFAVSLFLFLGTVIIGDYRAREELKRRFYI